MNFKNTTLDNLNCRLISHLLNRIKDAGFLSMSLAILMNAFIGLVSLLSLTVQSNAQAEIATGQKLIVQSARIVGDKSATRIILEFNSKPKYQLFYMEKPNRFVVELDNGKFEFGDDAALNAVGLVINTRYGAITSSKSRIVFSLDGPAHLNNQDLQSADENGAFRLILELTPIEQSDFSELIKKQISLLGASGSTVIKGGRVRSSNKKEGVFTIVIDAGHGGIDGGAIGSRKSVEKIITLKVAKLIGAALQEAGPFKVAYTRKEDVFVSLKQRLSFTKRQHADLMISLHADTLKQKYVRGATVYTLAKKASDKLAAEVAASENLSDIVAGLAAPEAKDDVTDILAELTLRETTRFSRSFSKALVNKLKGKINLIKNPQRSASFAVLKSPDVPSVLVELGYLSNKKDEALLTSDKWQKTAVKQIVATVLSFFQTRINAAAIKR